MLILNAFSGEVTPPCVSPIVPSDSGTHMYDNTRANKGIAGRCRAPRERHPEEAGRCHVAGSGAQVPLRTRTITSHRLRLKTYQDTESMREAFERLKQLCGGLTLDEDEEIGRMNPEAYNSGGATGPKLNRLPGHVIVHCFSYCDLPSLAQLSRVSRRLSVFANANHIWEQHARLLNKPIRGLETARSDLRFELCDRWDAEIREREQVYEELERRLHERATAERSTALDVEGVLNGNRRRVREGDILRGGIRSSGNTGNAYTAADLQALQAQVEQLEAVKLELLRGMRDLGDTLAQQQAQIRDIKNRLAVRVTEDGEVTTSTTGDEAAEGNATSSTSAVLTLRELVTFERRICRLVLSTAPDLPVVLRRGVEDFSTMEMVMQYSGDEVKNCVRQRWQTFKSFFPPLSNDYITMRFYVVSGEVPQSERRRESIVRAAGVVRRLMKMSDNEITSIVIQSSVS